MTIEICQAPYEKGQELFQKNTIDLTEGLTVLVGCNGAGKSTLLRQIKSYLTEKNIPVCGYNNLTEGGERSISSMINGYSGSLGLGGAMICSSEGERIMLNLGEQAGKYYRFLETGSFESHKNKLKLKYSKQEPKTSVSKKRFILFDAIDSGLSIDQVQELKSLFAIMVKDAQSMGVELYIVTSANGYEMCNGENCFDVTQGKSIRFACYDDFSSFILENRELKNLRSKK